MKQIIVLLGLAVVFTASAVSAQEKFDQVAMLDNIVKNLRVGPLMNDTCTLFHRYAAARALERHINENSRLLEMLRINSREVQEMKNQTAFLLKNELISRFQTYFLEILCDYEEQVGAGNYLGHQLAFHDVYEQIKEIRSLYAENPNLAEIDQPVETPYLQGLLVEYATAQGPKLRDIWLKDPGSASKPQGDESRKAQYLLWQLVTEEGIAPSVLGLKPEETIKLLEQLGLKPRAGTQ